MHGARTLGNPRIDPPARFAEVLIEVARSALPGKHGYMPNAGLSEAREAVAAYLKREQGVPLEGRHVIMTCGAAGAMNVVLKAVLNPGDQVLVSAPYFVEYGTYAENHGGTLVVEIGHNRAAAETAFPRLPMVWLPTAGADDAVFLVKREDLVAGR